MNRESNSYTIIYAAVMVIIVAIALAFTSQVLKDKQKENERVDKMQQILRSVRIDEKTNVPSLYAQNIVKELLVNEQGEIVKTFEGDQIAQNEAFGLNTANAFFNLKEKKKGELPVYIAVVDQQTKYVFPLNGAGLWGPIWGYVALNSDLSTVYGADFSHAGETPGLGAEIETAKFSSQFQDKHFFRDGSFTSIAVVKPGRTLSDQDYVDGISGGTLTSNGVNDMLMNCIEVYRPFIDKTLATADQASQTTVDQE